MNGLRRKSLDPFEKPLRVSVFKSRKASDDKVGRGKFRTAPTIDKFKIGRFWPIECASYRILCPPQFFVIGIPIGHNVRAHSTESRVEISDNTSKGRAKSSAGSCPPGKARKAVRWNLLLVGLGSSFSIGVSNVAFTKDAARSSMILRRDECFCVDRAKNIARLLQINGNRRACAASPGVEPGMYLHWPINSESDQYFVAATLSPVALA